LIVSITSAPVPAIYFRDQKVTFEELRARLSKDPPRERTLILKADRSTPYEWVVKVMNLGLEQGLAVVLATSAERQ
nr:biopolymer transporter ExbD [Verrucomicrobiota bacterium]